MDGGFVVLALNVHTQFIPRLRLGTNRWFLNITKISVISMVVFFVIIYMSWKRPVHTYVYNRLHELVWVCLAEFFFFHSQVFCICDILVWYVL
jgi:hypothetical protein